MGSAVGVLLAAVLAASAALGGDGPTPPPPPAPPEAVELPVAGYEALTSPEEARDDYPGLFAAWMAVLERDLDGPQAELILRRMRWLGAQTPLEEGRLARIEALIAKGAKRGETATLLALAKARLLRRLGRWAEADKVDEALAPVRHWAVAGPFGTRPAVDHYRSYAPEAGVDLSAVYPGTRGEIKWRMSPESGPGLTASVTRHMGIKAGVSYALAQIRSDEQREAYVHVNVGRSWKMWIGGELAYDADDNFDWVLAKAVVRIRLAKGWNRLLVKLASAPGEITCRLTDRKGFPLGGIEIEKAMKLHPQDAGSAALPYAAAPLECALEHYRRSLPSIERELDEAAKRRGACEHAGLALMLSAMGLHDEAVDQMAAAVKLWPDSAHLRYLEGNTIARAGHLPPSERRNRAREAYERAKKCPGGFIAASRAVAGQYVDDEKYEKALDELKAASKASPGAYLVKEQMAGIALDQGWLNEAHRWISEAERLQPGHLGIRSFWASYYAKTKNTERELAELREMMQRDRSGWADARVAAELAKRGKFEEALRLHKERLSRDPENASLRKTIARTLVAAGRLEEAAAEYRSIISLVSEDVGLHRALGDIYVRMGKTEEAMASYDEALKLAPGLHSVRRHVQYLRGEEADFSKPYPLDLAKELTRVGGPEKYPGSTKVLVLDQTVTKVYPDGSHTDIAHQAEKILTEGGVEALSTVSVPGEILEARVHLPDGTVLEPTVLEGRGSLTMPGLRVGATVEWKYRRDASADGWKRFRLGSWFFRSPDFDQPHHLSRYVVMIPKELDGSVVKMEHNWRRADGTPLGKPPAEKSGDHKVYRWVARNTKRMERERNMPHSHELLPFVDVGTAVSWDDVAYRMRGREFGRAKLTRELREASKKALEGLGEDAPVREKVHAVYRFVCELVKSRGGGSTAHQVLVTKSGDREILIIALLRAAGIEARYAYTRPGEDFITDGSAGPANWRMPSSRAFPHSIICAFDRAGRPVFFDGSNRYLEFGHVPLNYRGSPVLVPGAAGAQFYTMPGAPLDTESTNTVTELSVGGDRAASGYRAETHFGLGAAGRKSTFEGYDDSSRKMVAQRGLNRIFPGVEVVSLKFPGLTEIERPFTIRVDLKARDFVKMRGEAPVCQTGLSRLRLVQRFVAESKRKLPMKLTWAVVGRDEVTITFEEKHRLAGVPANVALVTEYGSYVLNFRALAPGKVRVLRTYRIPPRVISPKEYAGGFIDFLRAIDGADATEIGLIAE